MKLICGLVAALSTLMTAGPALAQTNYPDRPVRLLVGFAPAGPADIAARVVGEKLAEAWGKPVLVENVAGASGNIAVDRVAKSSPDGYTLVMAASSALVSNPSLYEKFPFDPLKDLAPISRVVFTPNILGLSNDVPAKTVQELVALARAKPGTLTFGHAGAGTSQHLAGELFKAMAKIDMQQVPYRGATPVMVDLIGGRISMFFGNISAILPQVQGGKVRGIAVTSLKRLASAPDLPTLDESGFPGFDANVWFGLMAPAGTPAAIVEKIHRDTMRALTQLDVKRRFADLGMEVVGDTPAEFAAVIRREGPVWAKLIKDIGIRVNE